MEVWHAFAVPAKLQLPGISFSRSFKFSRFYIIIIIILNEQWQALFSGALHV